MLRNKPLEVSKYRSVGQLPLLLSTQRLPLYSQKLVGGTRGLLSADAGEMPRLYLLLLLLSTLGSDSARNV